MQIRRCSHRIALALTLIGLLAAASPAGPLDPPAGPVAATGRTMILALPYAITTPGSYVVARSLAAANNTDNITISVGHVTLDLAGSTLTGHGGNNQTAIAISGAQIDVTIMNGSLSGWGGGGIIGTVASYCRIENIWSETIGGANPQIRVGPNSVVRSCRGNGAVQVGDFSTVDDFAGLGGIATVIAGRFSVVTACRCANGTGSGAPIAVGDGSTVSNCAVDIIAAPGITGIVVGNACVVRQCTVAATSSPPVGPGITAGTGCSLSACTVTNILTGIFTADGCDLTGCAVSNATTGITTGAGCSLSGCDATGLAGFPSTGIATGLDCVLTGCNARVCTTFGFNLGDNSRASRCVANSNGSSGSTAGAGFRGGDGITVENCTASSNFGTGISLGAFAAIQGCTAKGNTLDGINAGGSSSVTGCTCTSNLDDGIQVNDGTTVANNTSIRNGGSFNPGGTPTGAGIHSSGTENRIDSNHLIGNNRGLWAELGGNTIIRNSARINGSNFGNVAAGNDFPTASTVATATNPFANIAF